MSETSSQFVLILGNTKPEGVVSHLKTTGRWYFHKKLESSAENWESIIEYLELPGLTSVVARLNTHDYNTILREEYREVAPRLLALLGRVPHLLFVHETVFSGLAPETDVEYDEDERYFRQYYFDPPDRETRLAVNALLDENHINVIPYRTNAEVSVVAAAFVEDHEKNLLFRLYVPRGRIYAAEADRLLSLFREWITDVKGQRVRQDGYRTPQGQVYEFFGDDRSASTDLTVQFGDFSQFLELCVDDPPAASQQLLGEGVEVLVAEDMVRRYGKETKRLHVDLRHTREARLLSIRHRLESELLDAIDSDSPAWSEIDAVVERLVPADVTQTLGSAIAPLPQADHRTINLTINQQILKSVEGTVIQGTAGTLNLSPPSQELLRIIQQFGGTDGGALQSDLLELEDVDARPSDRIGAKLRLKAFLIKLGGRIEDTALSAAQKYVESKLGMGADAP